ncbi:hypothetical protein JMA_42580 (plasmid) [Jeotgalibacillus malaysiensis]|uniref:Uncharacterized protein n=1 Tax=Jeotgalibacillus malaysiensis TaxID=1508404 RepID=A0A0B5ATN7_9BACL|nr:hypothetical protein [Jeotgalibacillus malaysiensis]AJD93575.1 hypothetical protein JMA_42580 [Jeotgalibacillus malaysiensis]
MNDVMDEYWKKARFSEDASMDLKKEIGKLIQYFDSLLETNRTQSEHRQKAEGLLIILKKEHELCTYEANLDEIAHDYAEIKVNRIKDYPGTSFEVAVIDIWTLIDLQRKLGLKEDSGISRFQNPSPIQSNDISKLTPSEINEKIDEAIKKGHIDFLKSLARPPKQ